jgi:hypothetical protein
MPLVIILEYLAASFRAGMFECLVEEEHEVLQEAELSGLADSENNLGGSSETMYYIGLERS